MNIRNIKNINKRQLERILSKEGRVVTNIHKDNDVTVLFRDSGSISVTQEKVRIYYRQTEDINKGDVLKYGDTYYLVMNRNDIESDVFYSSNLIRCNAAWNIKGQRIYLVSGNLSSPNPTGTTVTLINGNISLQTSDIDFLHTDFPIGDSVYAFGGVYKLINKFFVDGLAFLHFERGFTNSSNETTVVYNGETTFDLGTYTLNPYVVNGSDYYVPTATFSYVSSDESIATINGDEISFNREGNVVITINSVGQLENGAGVINYSASTDVNITVVDPTPKQEHTITVENDGNGTAVASSQTAINGDIITLTATPNTGYVFKEWAVLNGSVTITNNTFIMPDEDVTVQALFEENVIPTYTVTINTDGNGTVMASQTVATAGTSITLSAIPNDGYEFEAWTVVSGGISITDNTFIMPENDVEISATFKELPVASGYTSITGNASLKNGFSRTYTGKFYDSDGNQITNSGIVGTWSVNNTFGGALELESAGDNKVSLYYEDEDLIGEQVILTFTDPTGAYTSSTLTINLVEGF